MMAPRWSLMSSLLLALGLLASPALAQLCLIDPISPLCCPSPCPVYDATRVPKLFADVESLGEAAAMDSQIAQTASQIGQSIGDAKAAATVMSQQLSHFAGTVSSEVTALQSGLPTNPVQAVAAIKQSLFEPIGVSSTTTQRAARVSARAAASQGEQIAAFATSLMRSNALPGLAVRQSDLAGTIAATQQVQSDLAANSASRLALYQDTGAIHQLVSAWVAQRSAQAAMSYPGAAFSPAGKP